MSNPQALLLPALSSISTRAEMLPLARRLDSAWDCVVPDWPGFGERPRARLADLGPDTLHGFLDGLIKRELRAPALGVAAGHAAPYLAAAARRHPDAFSHLVLIAPTWRGPLPTMAGPRRAGLARQARHLFEAPLLGPLLYRATTSPRNLDRMMRGHVYADAGAVTAQRVGDKARITRQPGARFATAAFISGALDPVGSRDAFLALFTPGLPPILLLRPDAAPPRSAAEMTALARSGRVTCATMPGALAAHEECPEAAADAIRAFITSRP